MHKISAHGVHLAVTDVLYKKPAAEPTEYNKELFHEEVEDADEEEEGLVPDRNVPDIILPDMSEDFRRIIQKVCNLAKFFRDFTELCK